MTRLSALIAYNGIGTSVGEMTHLLAVVAHRLVLALAGNMSGLLAAAAHHVVLAVTGKVAGLQAAEAHIARTESSAGLAPVRKKQHPILLRAVTGNMAGLLANAADHLGLLSSSSRLSSGLSNLLPTHQGKQQHSRGGLLSSLLSSTVVSSAVGSALRSKRGRTTNYNITIRHYASPPSGAAGFSGHSRAMCPGFLQMKHTFTSLFSMY